MILMIVLNYLTKCAALRFVDILYWWCIWGTIATALRWDVILTLSGDSVLGLFDFLLNQLGHFASYAFFNIYNSNVKFQVEWLKHDLVRHSASFAPQNATMLLIICLLESKNISMRSKTNGYPKLIHIKLVNANYFLFRLAFSLA